jgi:hypothetical protein
MQNATRAVARIVGRFQKVSIRHAAHRDDEMPDLNVRPTTRGHAGARL